MAILAFFVTDAARADGLAVDAAVFKAVRGAGTHVAEVGDAVAIRRAAEAVLEVEAVVKITFLFALSAAELILEAVARLTFTVLAATLRELASNQG